MQVTVPTPVPVINIPGDNLGCLESRNCVRRMSTRDFWSQIKRRLRLSPVPPVLSKPTFSLFLPVKIAWKSGTRLARALVDTGASFPLIVNKGFLPKEALQPSRYPVTFTDASGTVMPGGSWGAPLSVSVPVQVSERATDLVEAACPAIWALEVCIHEIDIILGYPFFRQCGLLVDATGDCLRLSSWSTPVETRPATALVSTVPGSSSVKVLEAVSPGMNCQANPEVFPPVLDVLTGQLPVQEVCYALNGCSLFECVCTRCLAVTPGVAVPFPPVCTLQEVPDVRTVSPVVIEAPVMSLPVCLPRPTSPVEFGPEPPALIVPVDFSGDADWTADRFLTSQETPSSETVIQPEVPVFTLTTRALYKTEEYAVSNLWYEEIVTWANLEPTVDAFASGAQHLLPRFWDPETDAFTQDWSLETLWMNPPFSRMTEVVDKIIFDGAMGILIIPVWTRFAWFHLLGKFAVDWMDLPRTSPVFQTREGKLLPPLLEDQSCSV